MMNLSRSKRRPAAAVGTPPPSLLSTLPTSGLNSGGTAITLTGTGFVTGCTVTVGGAPATSVVFVNSTSVTCSTPAGTPGAKDIVLTNPDLQSSTLAGGFTYTVFDPATLSLAGWWRGNYGGSPWAGVASAGTSAGRDLTEATNPPAVGAAQNGLTPADFDGVNDQLTMPGTLDTYAAPTAFSFWLLFLPDDVVSTGLLFQDALSRLQIYLQAGLVKFFHADSGLEASRAIAAGSYVLITGRFDGVNLTVGVNEAPGVAGGNSTKATGTAISNLTGAMKFSQTGGLNGRLLDAGLADVALSNATFDTIRSSYCSGRYGLSL